MLSGGPNRILVTYPLHQRLSENCPPKTLRRQRCSIGLMGCQRRRANETSNTNV